MNATEHLIKRLLQTEKGARIARYQQYLIDVAPEANKGQIKQAVEALFQVKVLRVNTLTNQGKWKRLTGRRGRRADWKKAIVTLADGQKLEIK